jgi:hypothetical protein
VGIEFGHGTQQGQVNTLRNDLAIANGIFRPAKQ